MPPPRPAAAGRRAAPPLLLLAAAAVAKDFGSHPPQGGSPFREDVPTSFDAPEKGGGDGDASFVGAEAKAKDHYGGKKYGLYPDPKPRRESSIAPGQEQRTTAPGVSDNPLNEGPKADFLNPKRNIAMSCSVCRIAFPEFKTTVQKMKEGNVDRDAISKTVMDGLKDACQRVKEEYSIRWGNGSPDGDGPGQNIPDEFFFRPKKEVSILHEGADEQMEWATEFIEHRCMWLRDKYGIEIGVNFAEQKMLTDACPITECNDPATQRARHTNDEL